MRVIINSGRRVFDARRAGWRMLPVWLMTALPVQAGPQTGVEERRRQIEADLAPLVLVEGEQLEPHPLEARMAALRVPGVSIAVIHQGKIDWTRGYGRQGPDGTPVTTSTLFQAASISKMLTAAAALRLVQTGRIDVETDVNAYLRRWKIPQSSLTDARKINLRELLSHTAGVSVHGFPGYESGQPLPDLVKILDGAPPANTPAVRVEAIPGTRWSYSGGGYVVVQMLIEDVTGRRFDELEQETVLGPAGMNDSTFAQPLPPARRIHEALPHDVDGKPLHEGAHIYPEQAPAGLWTTPTDLARFAIELQRELEGSSRRILSRGMARLMVAPGINAWGLGPATGGTAQRYFEHQGANAGYRCVLISYQTGEGVAVMTNSDKGDTLMDEVVRTVAEVYGWADFGPVVHRLGTLDQRAFDGLVGAYRLSPELVIAVSRSGDHLWMQAPRQERVEFFPERAPDAFFAKNVAASVDFERGPDGRGARMKFHQNGIDTLGVRLDDGAAQAVAEALSDTNARFAEQRPAPGGEEAIRRLMQQIAEGDVDYAKLGPSLREGLRAEGDKARTMVHRVGAIQTIMLERVLPDGGDVYRVQCEHRAMEMTLYLSRDGRMDNLSVGDIH